MTYTDVGKKVIMVVTTIVLFFAAAVATGEIENRRSQTPSTDSASSKHSYPLLPLDMAVFGSATSPLDNSKSDVFFQTDRQGNYKSEPAGIIYHAVFTRWHDNVFAILHDGDLITIDADTGEKTRVPTGLNTVGMRKGEVSPNKRHILLTSYPDEAGVGLTLTDGTRLVSHVLPYDNPSNVVTNDGTAYSLITHTQEEPPGFCVYSVTYEGQTHECSTIEQDRLIAIGVIGLVHGEPKVFVVWNSPAGLGWSLYEKTTAGWHRTNDQRTWNFNEEENGYLGPWLARDEMIYMFSDRPGLLRFPFPSSSSVDLGYDLRSLEDIVTGSRVDITVDGDSVNYTFYEGDLGKGQYLTSFSLTDPSSHTGPWRIPTELTRSKDEPALRAVQSLYAIKD